MSPLMDLDEETEEPSIAAERTRRMARALREAKPSRVEVRAAHARFVARRTKRRAVRVVPLALGFVSLLVSAFAFAAGVRFVSTHDVIHTLVPSIVSSLTPSSHAKAPARTAHARSPAPSAAPTESAPPAVDDDVAPLAPVESSPTAAALEPAPSTIAPTPSPLPEPPAMPGAQAALPTAGDVVSAHSPRAVSPPPLSTPSVASRAAPSVAPSVAALKASPEPAESSPWVVAAKAMRSGDYATAERAFEKLATRSDPQPRDEARLARAQVWLAEGRVSEARPELASLAAIGATPLVKQRAADALRKIDSSTP